MLDSLRDMGREEGKALICNWLIGREGGLKRGNHRQFRAVGDCCYKF